MFWERKIDSQVPISCTEGTYYLEPQQCGFKAQKSLINTEKMVKMKNLPE